MKTTTPHDSQDAARLQGAPNFRSIGPLPGAGGRRLRPNRVFRSGALHRLSDAERRRLAGWGVGTVLDLRREDERVLAPTRWHDDTPETLVFDAGPQLEAVRPVNWREQLARPGFDAAVARRWMLESYRRMPAVLAPAVTAVARRLLGPNGPTGESVATRAAVLVHCTAGKDRTGFVCAMLLTALEVPHEAILADYLESSRRWPPAELAATLVDPGTLAPDPRVRDAIETIASVQPEFLETAFSSARERHGSVDAFLAEACGLDASTRAALREGILE